MLQVIQKILENPQDKTKVSLIFANIAEQDILLKSYLDKLAKSKPDQFKLHYVLEKCVLSVCKYTYLMNRPPAGWTQSVGYVSESLIRDLMPNPSQGKVFICGPGPMMKFSRFFRNSNI